MKKLTVLFILLLSLFSFVEMSAQKIRYSVSRQTSLRILVNGIEKVNVSGTDITFIENGELTVASNSSVEVFASSDSGNNTETLDAVISEDDPTMIEFARNNDYNYLNEEHTLLYESFAMPPIDMYIEMKS